MAIRINQLLDRQVIERPESLAVSDTLGNKWSYEKLNAATDSLADQFTNAGVKTNDRVLVLLENCTTVVAAVFACARIGAVFVPLNARQSPIEIDRVINHSKPALILFTSAVSVNASSHAKERHAETLTGLFGTIDFVRGSSSPEDELHDVATLLYTTGTTGVPKGVMLTHENLFFAGAGSMKTRKLTPADIAYGVLPISHVFGLTSVVIACIYAGAQIRLAPRFLPADLYSALTSGVTAYSAVPQMHALLMQYTKEQGHEKLPSNTLRYVSSGAAPLDPDWKRRAELFFGVPVQNGYGMTETTAGICLTQHDHSNSDISVGKPFEGVEIRLDTTAKGSEQDVGEIQIRGGGVMKGYYKNSSDTQQAFSVDGWFRTGDLGRFDEYRNLHIVGRTKELIIHGGFNVYPPEVEAAINDHPQVIQCAVVGHAVDGDEKVYAFVQAAKHDWPDEEDIQAFIKHRLAGYKRPTCIVIAEQLPAASTGKILKHRLHELLK